MNTSAWGPPAWRVLHGLAALVPARETASHELRAWHACIRALRESLPCVYCRESFNYISRPLPRRDVDVWWWYVHELVNIKLEKRGMSFERARARARARGSRVLFSDDDIWLLLGAMSCNTDNATRDGASYAVKKQALCAFIRALRELLHLASRTVPRLRSVAAALALVCARWGGTRMTLLKTLSDVRSHPAHTPATSAQAFVTRVKGMCVDKPRR
jgi:hypothetical protein